jgi:hypothetical protein
VSRDSSFIIAMDYKLNGLGLIPGRSNRSFSTPQRPDQLWGPPSLQSMDTGGCFAGCKPAGAWSWPLTFRKCRGQERLSYTSTPSYSFMGQCFALSFPNILTVVHSRRFILAVFMLWFCPTSCWRDIWDIGHISFSVHLLQEQPPYLRITELIRFR